MLVGMLVGMHCEVQLDFLCSLLQCGLTRKLRGTSRCTDGVQPTIWPEYTCIDQIGFRQILGAKPKTQDMLRQEDNVASCEARERRECESVIRC